MLNYPGGRDEKPALLHFTAKVVWASSPSLVVRRIRE